MRVPLRWLRQFVPVDRDAEELARRLTLAGIEIENIDKTGVFCDEAVAGEIVSTATIADTAVRRVLVRVAADAPPIELVSGAPNLADAVAGTKVAVALPGAMLFDQSQPGYKLRKVSATKMYNVVSAGACVSAAELGLGKDHRGVLFLAGETPVGMKLRHAVPALPSLEASDDLVADEVLVVGILPNIARCQSIVGFAREVAAITGVTASIDLNLADIAVVAGAVDARIESPDRCGRFCTALVEQVTVCPSPDWMQRRLVLAGVEPINNIVDVTNYVMLELGQPMHAYDADRLADPVLGVRSSRAGESVRVLGQTADEDPRPLPEDTLVITNQDRPVAVAGVIGGLDTAISDQTTNLLIESANFDFVSIRKTQQETRIHTEASARFSRGVDPELAPLAVRRMLALLEPDCPGLSVAATGFAGPPSSAPRVIPVTMSELNGALGTDFSSSEVAEALARVGIECAIDGDALSAKVTSARPDVTQPCDLYEEAVRLLGYDRLPATMPLEPIPMHLADPALENRERVRDAMVLSGLQEIITYTLSRPEATAALYAGVDPIPELPHCELLNPISPERRAMRRSLLPGLLETLRLNLRFGHDAQLFEMGVVVHPEEPGVAPTLPRERQSLAWVMTGYAEPTTAHRARPAELTFADAAAVAEFVLRHLHLAEPRIEPAAQPPYHPGVCGRVVAEGRDYGFVGQLHPRVAEAFDLGKQVVFAAELDLDALAANCRPAFQLVEPPRLPSVELDLSVVVDKQTAAGRLLDLVRSAQEPMLHEIEVVDVYAGSPLPEQSKSVTLRFLFNAGERSLQMEEAMALRQRFADLLQREIGATPRV